MQTIAQTLNSLIEQGKTPSVQYYFFDQNDILDSFRAGYANIEQQIPVNDANTYHAFSLTKTFTGLATLQLVEQQKLNLDTPVMEYLPAFHYGGKITVRQLLSHSAGLPNPLPLDWIHLLEEHADFDRDDYFNRVMAKNHKVKFEPNTRMMYSNLGYIVLGQLIEAISGQTYEEYITQHVIARMGLKPADLGFEISNPQQHAKGYHKRKSFSYLLLGLLMNRDRVMDKSEGKWKSLKPFYLNGAPYGGLIGKPCAFVRYIQTLMQDENPLLAQPFKKQLFQENQTLSHQKTGMTLSWFISQLKGHTFYTHAGGGPGYYCEMRIYPELNRGSVIFFNRTGFSDERFLSKIDRSLLNFDSTQ